MLTILAAALSCSGKQEQVRQTLAAADSLMTAQPQAALDTLMTIDSSDAESLPRADRAFHTLLRTEAEYKCWLPVAEDSAISEAVDYYRRKPERGTFIKYSNLIMNALRFSDLPGPGFRDTSGNGIPAFKVRHQNNLTAH